MGLSAHTTGDVVLEIGSKSETVELVSLFIAETLSCFKSNVVFNEHSKCLW